MRDYLVRCWWNYHVKRCGEITEGHHQVRIIEVVTVNRHLIRGWNVHKYFGDRNLGRGGRGLAERERGESQEPG